MKAWVEQVNDVNVDRMRQESITVAAPLPTSVDDATTEEDPLADCQITMLTNKLLNLVPWFCQMVETRMREDPPTIAAHFTESVKGRRL